MAVAIHNAMTPGAFTSRSSAPRRTMQARPTHMRQGLVCSPSQQMWTGSRMRTALLPHHLQQQRGVVCQGLFGLGLPEIAVIAGVAALIFGPSKLPELGKGLGKTVKSFQTAAKEFKSELEAAASEGDDSTAAAAASAEKEADKAASKKE